MFEATEHFVKTWDGSQLFYRAWLPDGPPRGAVILFHRGHEHSGRLTELVEKLQLDGFAYFAWDARGNGKSPGRRDYADHFSHYVRDAECFVRHVSATHGVAIKDMAVVANSVGGVIAAAWVHDYAPPIRALVLATPAFRIKLYVPLAIPMLRLAWKLGMMKTVKSYVKSVVLTHDRKEQAGFNADPLITRSIATNILLDVHDTSTRLVADAGAVRVPTLMHAAGADWVVHVAPQRRFFERLSSPVKQWVFHPTMYHAIYHEVERDAAIESTRRFIRQAFDDPAPPPDVIHDDTSGFTRVEYDRLRQPSANPTFAVSRMVLKSAGRLSRGIALGLKEGFDSGVTLDYVYQNRAQGITPIGRMIDRAYLNSIGWRGIRQRRVHMREMLRQAVGGLREAGKAVHVVDIAAGPGRYLLETIQSMPEQKITATLRDYKQVNIDQGRRIAEEMKLQGVTFELGDAFDRPALARLSPRPTLGIVSGLYELFPENRPVFNSLQGLADAIEPGGYLIYTNQPWHPQVEFIARVLTNREGKPWIMRRRTQQEMDGLVAKAGFEKIGMLIDPWGIFTVSLARRI